MRFRLYLFYLFVLVLWQPNWVMADSIDSVKVGLLSDIKHAQNKLEQTQQHIERERTSISLELRELQGNVVALRQKNAVKRRMLDDQTLALSKIQARLDDWQRQENYQLRLLSESIDTFGFSSTLNAAFYADINTSVSYFRRMPKLLQSQLTPKWQEAQIKTKVGQIQQASVLSAGQHRWFVQPDLRRAGLLDKDNQINWIFNAQHTQHMLELQDTSKGLIVVDPSQGALLELADAEETLYEHLTRGGIWVLPILGFAALAMVIALLKAWQLWRLPPLNPVLAQRIEMLTTSDDIDAQLRNVQTQLQGAQLNLVELTLQTERGDRRDDRLLAFLLDYRERLQSYLGAIAITAAVAPLLGLLGTVSGMIETFNMMNLFGAGDPAVVSGGISKALITTELGLVVAIPALILHALLSRFIRHHHAQLDTTAIRLGELGNRQDDLDVRKAA